MFGAGSICQHAASRFTKIPQYLSIVRYAVLCRTIPMAWPIAGIDGITDGISDESAGDAFCRQKMKRMAKRMAK
jgi:hypothetical protein